MDDDHSLPYLGLAAALLLAALSVVAVAFLQAGDYGRIPASVARGGYRLSVSFDDRARLTARYLSAAVGFYLAGAAAIGTAVRHERRRAVLWTVMALSGVCGAVFLLGLLLSAAPTRTTAIGRTSTFVLTDLGGLAVVAGAAWVAAAGLGLLPSRTRVS